MKRKRQGWSNCNILKQLHITEDQEKLAGNTVDVVFRSCLAGNMSFHTLLRVGYVLRKKSVLYWEGGCRTFRPFWVTCPLYH